MKVNSKMRKALFLEIKGGTMREARKCWGPRPSLETPGQPRFHKETKMNGKIGLKGEKNEDHDNHNLLMRGRAFSLECRLREGPGKR